MAARFTLVLNKTGLITLIHIASNNCDQLTGSHFVCISKYPQSNDKLRDSIFIQDSVLHSTNSKVGEKSEFGGFCSKHTKNPVEMHKESQWWLFLSSLY